MAALMSIILALGAAFSGYAIWRTAHALYAYLKPSPLRYIPGPPSPSWLFGNLKQLSSVEEPILYESWVDQYGKTIKFKGWFSRDTLFTMDTKALNHILTHSSEYPKPEAARFGLSQLLGKGVLVVEGEQHRQQRRIMNPAFGPAQIRELTGIFLDKALQLRDVWKNEVLAHGDPAQIDVVEGMSKMTLDVIGLAGFNYSFDSLNVHGKPNELNAVFRTIFGTASNTPSIFALLKYLIPPFRLIPTARSRKVAKARGDMRRIGMQLIAEKKADVMRASAHGTKTENEFDGLQNRDLLTLLIKANMATDLPEDHRLSDEDVLAQVPTFLVAGHETTSTATTWCLYALSQAPEIQQKLREELLDMPTDHPTMDELQELPYLDAVVRETMRLYSPVPSTVRAAGIDDVIPLNEPYTDIRGAVHDGIRVEKGTAIEIPLLALHRSKELWGVDALEFKPERWESIPDTVHGVPGVWSHLMTFLGGPRACIGYRFSIVEMKALVFTLVRALEFELDVSPHDIGKQGAAVRRPIVKSEKHKGSRLPMRVKLYKRE
ncbi:cytochrome P450 [Wolfiporia cocos MD-104 SS10]|uniref:Cytochrome P450 n=1 Tax=Wolfiporia cocos (strain MD-104) TaxID=742152 RepID=A0A2H3IWF4_WOLCO|nr:cytochrome P450 [Wolfiporia cocos MD-104 SS10]